MKTLEEKAEDFFNDSHFVTADFWAVTPLKGKWTTMGANMSMVFEFAIAFHKHALEEWKAGKIEELEKASGSSAIKLGVSLGIETAIEILNQEQ